MKKYILISFLFSFFTLWAQDPQILWQNTIGGDMNDALKSAVATSDGGYILAGESNSDISGDKTENSQGEYDYWVIKLDASGEIEWQKTIGGSGFDRATKVIQTLDGGYLVGGTSNSDISGDKTENSQGFQDYWIIKLSANGTIEWQNTIGGEFSDILNVLVQTNDGGFIVGGDSLSGVSGDKTEPSNGGGDFWLLKLTSTGTITWQRSIGGSSGDDLEAVVEIPSGFAIAGKSESDISGDKTENAIGDWDYWIVGLDASGNVTWQNTIGGTDHDDLNSMIAVNDGGFLLVGESNSDAGFDKSENALGSTDYWVVKVNGTGQVEWENTIGGAGQDELRSAFQANDGTYFIGGASTSDISIDKTENSLGTFDYWVLQLDTSGNILWQNTIGATESEYLWQIGSTLDNELFIAGESWSEANGDKDENSEGFNDYWIIKMGVTLGVPEVFATENIKIYPNPVSDVLVIDTATQTPVERLKVFSSLGALLKTETNTNRLNIHGLSPGIYYVEVNLDGKSNFVRFVKK